MRSMDCVTVDAYWKAITMIEAQDIMTSFMIQDWSHMKPSPRTALKKKIHRSAYPIAHKKSDELTNEELAKRIQRAVNG